jgi:hypothetical protein
VDGCLLVCAGDFPRPLHYPAKQSGHSGVSHARSFKVPSLESSDTICSLLHWDCLFASLGVRRVTDMEIDLLGSADLRKRECDG